MAKKQAYYFPHFISARNDSKILKLRRVLGVEGYAIYFMLLEVLREQSDMKQPLSSLEELDFEFRVPKDRISAVITDFDLFVIEDGNFYSPKLIEYMEPYFEKSQRAKIAANKKWEQQTGMQKHTETENSNAVGMQKHPHAEKRDATNKLTNKLINKEIKSTGVDTPPSPPKPDLSPEEKLNILSCKQNAFFKNINSFAGDHRPEMLQAFFDYWKEPNSPKTKMRWEMEKTWDLKLRLTRWEKSQKFQPADPKQAFTQQHNEINLLS